MNARPASSPLSAAIDRFAVSRPDLVQVAPMMVYLVLLGLAPILPPTWQPFAIVLRGAASLGVVVLLWRHLPGWGKPYAWVAVLGGVLVGWGWVVGQHVFDQMGLGGRLPIMPGEKVFIDPRGELGFSKLFRTTIGLRLLVACTVVPVVEEIFWRGFLLRAFVNWQDFEKVPVGTFTWASFLGTSLLSTLQHPDNWGVSILCWMVFNGVFYWTRSILCLILLHGMTNLVLYLLVLRTADWSFI